MAGEQAMKATVECAAVAFGSADWGSDVCEWIHGGEEIRKRRGDEYDQSDSSKNV
jgi:hypothetical protein